MHVKVDQASRPEQLDGRVACPWMKLIPRRIKRAAQKLDSW